MKNSHEGRVAVVTGAGRGIGREIAIRLAERGAELVLIDLEEPTETARAVGGTPLVLAGDVAQQDNWLGFAQAVDSRFARADIVVNNAGIYPFAPIDDVDEALWDKTLRVNLYSHFYSAKAFLPLMRRNGWGRFVNTSSNSIGTPTIGLSHYMAAKMGVMGFVRGLANEVGDQGITVNAIVPALTNTPGTSGMTDEQKKEVWGQQAIKRFAEPYDIVGPILFLTSDDAAFVTGQALVADGGMYKIS
jgi:NAD(P)-dependent dehydrogenase (short-subunit alcohol dehydrogenase family)